MSRRLQMPDVKPNDGRHVGDTVATHPAFGLVTVHQWHGGGQSRLFGSDLGHHVGITLKFSAAEQHRGLSNDWNFARETLLEVEMSEAQWARFVASSGNGGGVPVTIRERRDGPMMDVPGIAAPEASKRELHGEEMARGLRERLAALKAITDRLGEMLNAPAAMSKKELRGLHSELARHVQQAPGSVQFVYDQFARATEQVAEDAKVEVEAHVMGVATRLGLENLRELAPKLTGATPQQAPATLPGETP